VTGSHLEEPLEASTKKGTPGEEVSGEFGREASHIWPCDTQHSPLTSHFFVFKYPLKVEQWLRKEEQLAFSATGPKSIWLTDGDAGGMCPAAEGLSGVPFIMSESRAVGVGGEQMGSRV